MVRNRFRKLKTALLIFLILLILPFASLFILSRIHHHSIHEELTNYVEQELDGNVTFADLTTHWLHNFPNIRVSLHELSVPDRDAEVVHINQADFILNPLNLVSGEVKIMRVDVRGGTFRWLIDSLGNKPMIFNRKKNASKSQNKHFLVEADHITLSNISLIVINKIKGNRIYAGIDEAMLKLESADSMLLFSGNLQGRMDSLIANQNKLISNQAFSGRDVLFSVNNKTGLKKLESGYLMAHGLKLIPQLQLEPHPEGQIIKFRITTENTFDSILELLMFHIGLDIQQMQPDAVLRVSFRQQGLINPRTKPYTEIDFEVSNAEFSGQSLPYPLTIESLKGNYNNGEKHSNETMELVIDTIRAEIQESFVNARLKLTNLKDPVINASFISKIDLEHLPGQNEKYKLTGTIEADVELNGRISELKEMHLEGKQQAKGSLQIKDLKLELHDYGHIIGLSSGTTLLNNHMLEVSSLIGSFNQSAFHFQGLFHNLDQYFQNSEEELSGSFTLEFDKLDLRNTIQSNSEDAGKSTISLPYKNNALTLKIKGNEIITDFGTLQNIRVNSTLNDHVLSYNDLYFNVLDGSVSGDGEIILSDSGISSVQSDLDLMFNKINIDSIAKSLSSQYSFTGKRTESTIPFELDARVKFEAEKLIYKDLWISDASSSFELTENTLLAEDMQGMLPFGNFLTSFSLSGFDTENPNFKGDIQIKIDSLSVDDLMHMDALAKNSTEPNSTPAKSEGFPSLSKNIELKLLLEADHLYYQQAAMSNMGINISVVNDKISLNDLRFNFSQGNITMNGFLEFNGTANNPGYLYAMADSVDISSLLDAFDQFKQDKFTSDNSDGNLSWALHYYFTMNDHLEPQRDENLMVLNFNIHDAVFSQVEPIEKTLFFVGYKSKEHMLVEDLNINAFLFQDKLYFLDLLMNDNIANLDAYGMVDILNHEMDVSLEISLSDLFFRSKKKRMLQTQKGIVNLEDDAKIFLKLFGPIDDHKLDLISKTRFGEERKTMIKNIRNAEAEFKNKNAGIPES